MRFHFILFFIYLLENEFQKNSKKKKKKQKEKKNETKKQNEGIFHKNNKKPICRDVFIGIWLKKKF